MEDKKTVKVSLGTSICIFIIIVLIVALGVVYYKNNQTIIALKDEVNALKSKNSISQSEKAEIKTNDNNATVSKNEKVEVKTNSVNNNIASTTNNSTKKEFKPENFKSGTYVYSFTSENEVDSRMVLSFKDDNTVVLIPHRSNGFYMEGTYKIEYQEEGGMDLPGKLYFIKCTIDKWSSEPSGEMHQKAFSPAEADIIILDEENVMIEYMSPLKLRKDDTKEYYFGEGVKFTLEK